MRRLAACGDNIWLEGADDEQLMVLAPAMEGSAIRLVSLVSGRFGAAGLAEMKRVAAANGLIVSEGSYWTRPGHFRATPADPSGFRVAAFFPLRLF